MSFSNSLQDSGKILQEKFALVRELDRLRLELEHLQSQLSNHQAVVADKHRLRRQLDSLEVELENEKRSRQRARDKENRDVAAELKSRAEDAEKRLTSEKRERDRTSKEYERSLSDATSRNERLEGQIIAMNEALEGLQAELTNTKSELERHGTGLNQTGITKHSPKRPVLAGKQLGKKIQIGESSLEGITIQTPGDEHRVEKRPPRKRGGEHAPVGEKSNFSVTPFLNRNKSVTEGSRDSSYTNILPPVAAESASKADAEEQSNALGPTGHLEKARPPRASPAKPINLNNSNPRKPRGRPKAKRLAESQSSRRNTSNQPERTPVEPSLDPEAEDLSNAVDQENIQDQQPGKGLQGKAKSTLHPAVDLGLRVVGDVDGRKKKRKLLGGANTTIFDDNDGEAMSDVADIPPVQGAKRKRAPLGGASNAFTGGGFSPLKRDRRGVGASFLA